MLKSMCAGMFTLLSMCCYGQIIVKGSVTDLKTGSALPQASVQVSGTKNATLADDDGHFELSFGQPGTYQLAVSFVGYVTKTVIAITEADQVLQIALDPATTFTDEVIVSATRASEKTPTTYTTVNKEDIQKQNFGQDLPFLLNWTPSVVTTSDAGTGVGYTGIRIRGSDPTRVNVTINGIPYNDSESLGTFWVDIPDIASSSQNIQIQRGVGTSTNGAGAFGATINLQTNQRNDKAYGELTNTYGSFNTHKHTFSFGSGLLNNHWVVEGRVSRIKSDGFIDRATADLKSYYFSTGFYSGNTIVKAVVFGGKERTYQAWNGVPESKLNNDADAMETTAMNEGWNEIQIENLKKSNNRTFNPFFYKNQVDDYQQDHYQLHFSQRLAEGITWNTSLHYTPGKGYYEEYRYDDKLKNYGLKNIVVDDDGIASDNDTISSVDLIRRRWLDNKFYGFTYSLNYDQNSWNVVLGGGWNRYDGDHYGEVLWTAVSPPPTEYRYYFNNGDKRDFNTYLKVNYQIGSNLNAFVDLQYRRITYTVAGTENKQDEVNVNTEFNFFNPKAGLTYSLNDRQQLYTSWAVAHREPVRSDYTDFPDSAPQPEKLNNLEAGYRHAAKNFLLHANYFYMDYKNQLVLTGQLNDVGAPIRTNAGASYRTGVELEGTFKLSKTLQWNANVTVSRNKIRSYTDVLEDYGDNFDEYNIVKKTYRHTDIAFSPNLIAGSQLIYHLPSGIEVALLTKFVGKQYLDNTADDNRSIDPYIINDLRIGYSWKPPFIREINFSLLVNNLLDETYESNGYTWGYFAGKTEYRENYFYPQAGRNFMGMINIKF